MNSSRNIQLNFHFHSKAQEDAAVLRSIVMPLEEVNFVSCDHFLFVIRTLDLFVGFFRQGNCFFEVKIEGSQRKNNFIGRKEARIECTL